MSNTPDNSQPSADESDPEPASPTDNRCQVSEDLEIDVIVDRAVCLNIDTNQCVQAARVAAGIRGFDQGEICIRITDDPSIQQLNAKHLGHDYATDVISFGYDCQAPMVNGELVVSIDTAKQRSDQIGWPLAHELLLYIVHGVLHITGMDDHQSDDRAEMRRQEQVAMLQLGIDDIVRFGADNHAALPETQA